MMERFEEHFGQMTDPRVERSRLYPLNEILFMLMCGNYSPPREPIEENR